MKKGLLLLLAVFSMGMARAQVEVTDVSGMDYAIYGQEIIASVGTEVELPICLKNATNASAFQGHISLPEGFSFVEIGDMNSQRMKKGSQVFEGNDNNGPIFFMATILSKSGFLPGDGIIGYIKISIGADVEPGEYPVTVDDYKIAGLFEYDAENDLKINEANYTDQTGEGIISKIIVTEDVVLYETSTTAPARQSNINVIVNRTIKAKEWSTICLPFAMSNEQVADVFGSDVEVAEFVGVEVSGSETEEVANINVLFESKNAVNEGLTAHNPYIIKVSQDITQFRVEGVSITRKATPKVDGEGGAFVGTYIKQLVPEADIFLSGNKFWYSKGQTTTKAFRGYFEFDDVLDEFDAAEVKMNLVLDNTTKIENIDSELSNGVIYNLNGVKVGTDQKNLGKGIYIVNGKKIVK